MPFEGVTSDLGAGQSVRGFQVQIWFAFHFSIRNRIWLSFGCPLIYLNGWGFGSGLEFAAIVGAVMGVYGHCGLYCGRGY